MRSRTTMMMRRLSLGKRGRRQRRGEGASRGGRRVDELSGNRFVRLFYYSQCFRDLLFLLHSCTPSLSHLWSLAVNLSSRLIYHACRSLNNCPKETTRESSSDEPPTLLRIKRLDPSLLKLHFEQRREIGRSGLRGHRLLHRSQRELLQIG